MSSLRLSKCLFRKNHKPVLSFLFQLSGSLLIPSLLDHGDDSAATAQFVNIRREIKVSDREERAKVEVSVRENGIDRVSSQIPDLTDVDISVVTQRPLKVV